MTGNVEEDAWVDSPHLGGRRGRTLVGLVFVSVLTLALLTVEFVPRLLLTGDEDRFLLWMFNGLTGVVLFALLFSTFLGVVYGLWNGGPVLAAAIPLVPAAIGHAIAAQPVATVDLSLALAADGAGGILATLRVWRVSCTRAGAATASRAGLTQVLTVGVSLSVATTVMGAVFLWRLLETSGTHAAVGLWMTGVLLAVALSGLCVVVALVAVPHRVPQNWVRPR